MNAEIKVNGIRLRLVRGKWLGGTPLLRGMAEDLMPSARIPAQRRATDHGRVMPAPRAPEDEAQGPRMDAQARKARPWLAARLAARRPPP